MNEHVAVIMPFNLHNWPIQNMFRGNLHVLNPISAVKVERLHLAAPSTLSVT